MEEIYTGPYCEALKLTSRNLVERNISAQCNALKNGVILELLKLFKRDIKSVITVIQTLCSDLKEINASVLNTKIYRLVKTKDKFRQKKKVQGFDNLKDLLDAEFHVARRILKSQPEISQDPEVISSSDLRGIEATCAADIEIDTDHEIPDNLHGEKEFQKAYNILQYDISKQSKKLSQVLDNISCAETKLEDLQRRIGHYSLKNMKKRDDHHRRKWKILSKRIRRQSDKISKLSMKLNTQRKKLKQLQLENKHLKEFTDDKISIDEEIRKKRVAQKSASHFRLRCSKMQKSKDEYIQAMDMRLEEKEIWIQTLEIEIENLSSQIFETIRTKEKDGTFTENLRMCIIELSGLEVATQKVSPVIMCISKHLFGKILKKDDLPSTPTVQAIVDEGHFLAKKFISEQLAAAEHWGVNRDGTTRKKQKIIDTSITLSSGSIISLGFTRVGSETASAIHNVTKDHLMELANIHGTDEAKNSDEFIKLTLKKLAFCMSDRASNQKKANQLLSEWRDDMIKDFADQDTSPILNFYCMAHVLLGFHTYCCKDIREYEKTLVSKHGQLGRDSLAFFRTWNSQSSILERVVRTVSEIFGPAGDHYGIRDLWEGYCQENGVKSVIGNYRDNRFNALFQTSAEVLLHREQFLEVLEMVKNPNLKLKAVKADLQSQFIGIMLQCFGLVYIKITGPFWNLITKSDVSYLQLKQHVQDIHTFLENCKKNQSIILRSDIHWTEDITDEMLNLPHRNLMVECLFTVDEDTRNELFSCLKVVASAMNRTIEKQLADFLPGGKFGGPPSEKDIDRTQYAQTTNLGCEHHFGDLDHSQRRRLSASMHHHSSVQLLKRNRMKMMKWLQDMPLDDRRNLMKTAQKGGKTLHKKHVEREKSVLKEIVVEKKNKKIMKNRSDHSMQQQNEAELQCLVQQVCEQLPKKLPSTGEYIVVAYQDSWYPGIVEATFEDSCRVRFMAASQKIGVYFWPDRDDLQNVNHEFILKIGLVPECMSSGRLWEFPSFTEIQNLFEKFSSVYF